MAKYYVLGKTLFQGDKFTPIAGPFTNKAEADKVASAKSRNGFNEHGLQNLKDVYNTIVATQTSMKRNYGFDVYRASEIIWEIERREEEQRKDWEKFLAQEIE